VILTVSGTLCNSVGKHQLVWLQ